MISIDAIKNIIHRNRQFILYYFIGNIAVVMDLGLLYLFTEVFGLFYLLSATLSFCSALFVNYLLNKKYTFKNKSKKYLLQYTVLFIGGLIALGFNLLILWVLVERTGLWYIYSKIISLILVLLFTYNYNKYVVYGMIK